MPTPTLLPNNPAVQLQSPGVLVPGALTLPFTAADTVNGNAFVASGNDLLLVFNADEAAHNLVISSAPDAYGRFADVHYSLPVGHSVINITAASLYTQATQEVLISADSAEVFFAVIMNA